MIVFWINEALLNYIWWIFSSQYRMVTSLSAFSDQLSPIHLTHIIKVGQHTITYHHCHFELVSI